MTQDSLITLELKSSYGTFSSITIQLKTDGQHTLSFPFQFYLYDLTYSVHYVMEDSLQ